MMFAPPVGTMVTASEFKDLVLYDTGVDTDMGWLVLKYSGQSLSYGQYGIVVKPGEVKIPGNKGRFVWILLGADSHQYLVPLEHLKKVK